MIETIKIDEQGNKVCIDKAEFEELLENVESLGETVEILSNPEMMQQIKSSEQDILNNDLKDISSDKDLRNLLGI
jgi:PHD/YefM family antitoxin component YafN of YafNO toxin-antitoxin module